MNGSLSESDRNLSYVDSTLGVVINGTVCNLPVCIRMIYVFKKTTQQQHSNTAFFSVGTSLCKKQLLSCIVVIEGGKQWSSWLVCRWSTLECISLWSSWLVCRWSTLECISLWSSWLVCRWSTLECISLWSSWLVCRWSTLECISLCIVVYLAFWTIQLHYLCSGCYYQH